jgi:uncharacterized protein YkwD
MFCSVQVVIVLVALAAVPSVFGQSVEENDMEMIRFLSEWDDEARPADAPEVARLIIQETNEFRAAHERAKVAVSPRLAEAAQYFAEYMAKHDRYGHTADGKRPAERAVQFGYDYCLVSENIAYQYSSAEFATAELAQRFVEAWENSPRHRQNTLDPDVVETGVAAARSETTGYWYAVQMFGRPASAAIEFAITNRTDSVIAYTIGENIFELPPRYTRTHMRCRQPSVKFELSEAQAGFKTIQPAGGDQYTVVEANGQLRIRREA